jgi:hypothetical protein
LQALLFYTLTLPLLQRCRPVTCLAVAIAVSASVGFSGYQLKEEPSLYSPHMIFAPHRALYIWFVLGYLLAEWTKAFLSQSPIRKRAVGGLSFLLLLSGVGAVMSALGDALIVYRYSPRSMAVAACGIAAVLLLCSCLRTGSLFQRIFSVFGTYSLEVYIIHIAVLGFTRRVVLNVTCLIILAAIFSLAAAIAIRRSPARFLFTPPAFSGARAWLSEIWSDDRHGRTGVHQGRHVDHRQQSVIPQKQSPNSVGVTTPPGRHVTRWSPLSSGHVGASLGVGAGLFHTVLHAYRGDAFIENPLVHIFLDHAGFIVSGALLLMVIAEIRNRIERTG